MSYAVPRAVVLRAMTDPGRYGTELSDDCEILCRLPVLGSSAERFIVGALPRLMEPEADAARPLLERYA